MDNLPEIHYQLELLTDAVHDMNHEPIAAYEALEYAKEILRLLEEAAGY